MKDVVGKVADVTGAGQGIGRALVERFTDEGMKAVVADVVPDLVEKTTAELRDDGRDVLGVVTITECLWGQLREADAKVSGSLLYPSTRTPGVLNTGIWKAGANRPDKYDRPGAPPKEGRDSLSMYEARME